MTEKRRIKVDWFELSAAFELGSMENHAFLDLETGDVIWITDEGRRFSEKLWEEIPEDQDLIAAMEALLPQRQEIPEWQHEEVLNAARIEFGYGHRYVGIDPEPYSDYNDMERFVWSMDDDELADRLAGAIRGRGAFRRFKDLLARHPRVEQAWYDFKAMQVERRIRDWLDDNDIEPVE